MTPRPLAFVLLVLGTAVLAGCGDADAEKTGPEPAAAAPTQADEPAPAKEISDPSPALESALADVRRVAPKLEGYYRAKTYPTALDAVVESMPKAGLELSSGNILGAYKYDPAAVEFVLCVQNSAGAFATYDTAPMATGAQGESGGCPAL